MLNNYTCGVSELAHTIPSSIGIQVVIIRHLLQENVDVMALT
jgi:hypothetical protein